MTLRLAVLAGAGRRMTIGRRVVLGLLAVAAANSGAWAQDSLKTAKAAADSLKTAKVVGKVIDAAGIPVARAEVAVLPAMARRVTTDDSGSFRLDGLPIGVVQLAVRRLGFEAATFTAQLKSGPTQRVTLPLTQLAAAMPEIDVKDTAQPHAWLRTFDRRRGMAATGTFITREDIVRSQARVISDVLRQVPGVKVNPTNFGTRVLMDRGGPGGAGSRGPGACSPQIYVHSMTYSGNVDDFQPEDIEAMEVYVGISQVPAEPQSAKAHTCGAIVIWTREPPPAPKKVVGGE